MADARTNAASPEPIGNVDPPQLSGLRQLRDLLPVLATLRDVGCERDVAGNRDLHFDQYVTLVLLYPHRKQHR